MNDIATFNNNNIAYNSETYQITKHKRSFYLRDITADEHGVFMLVVSNKKEGRLFVLPYSSFFNGTDEFYEFYLYLKEKNPELVLL